VPCLWYKGKPGVRSVLVGRRIAERPEDNDITGSGRRRYATSERRDPKLWLQTIDVDG